MGKPKPKRLAVLYAGGTIGMVRSGSDENNSALQPGHALPDALRTLIQNHTLLRPHDWRIHTLQPLLDSANAQPAHWVDLAARLWQQHQDCDAAVILHGTDTMDYACAMLAFLMQGWQRPVVFTGAQYPLGAAGSDAERNVQDALLCAVNGSEPLSAPVMLCMGGQMLSGARVVKMGLDVAQGFQTPHAPKGGVLQKSAPAGSAVLAVLAALQTGEPARVGVLRLYPGMPADLLAWMGEQHPDGLVLQSYGCGTGATDSRAFCAALNHVCQQNVPVIAVSQCPFATVNLTTYEAGRGLQQAGVLSGGDMTTAAAFAKLHWLAGLRRLGAAPSEHAALQRWIQTPLVDEISPVAQN